MDLQAKLGPICGSPSLYMTGFLTPKSTIKRLTLQTSPVIGRCISEIKISSEKTSPLPTPIIFNFLKPKTPTLMRKPKISIKYSKKIEPKSISKEKQREIITPQLKMIQRPFSKKQKLKIVEPAKKDSSKLIENNKKVKEFGKKIRKQNLKFKSKRFTPEAPWGIDDKKVVEETRLKREAELISQSKLKKTSIKKKKLKIGKAKKQKKNLKKNDENEKIASIIKIQAFFRGYLTRKKLKIFMENKHVDISSQLKSSNMFEEYSEEDEEVRKIIKNNNENEKEPIISILQPLEIQSSKFDPVIKGEMNHNLHLERVLTSQITWRLKQQAKLKELKHKDIQEMKFIAEKFGNQAEIVDLFRKIIERRYEKLNRFFEDHIESLKTNLISHEISESLENSDLDSIFARISAKNLKQTSGEIGEDIEKIWQQIETIEQENETSSFLQDPQPLPPLTPIYEEYKFLDNEVSIGLPQNLSVSENDDLNRLCLIRSHENSLKNEEEIDQPGNFFAILPQNVALPIENETEPVKTDAKRPEILNFEGPVSRKIPDFNVITDGLSMTLEHSEALKDYSSIVPSPIPENNDEYSSLEYELNIKCKSNSNKEFPISPRQIFERDSPSNPFSITSEHLSDHSGEDIVVSRVMNLLEVCIYHDFFDAHIEIFENIEFSNKFLDDYIGKLIGKFINEALMPRVIINTEGVNKCNDQEYVLQFIDKTFLEVLKSPHEMKKTLNQIRHPLSIMEKIEKNLPLDYISEEIFNCEEKEGNDYEQIHNEMLIQVCNQAFLEKLDEKFLRLSNFLPLPIDSMKFSEIFLEVRETLFDWNEIKSGTIPLGDTLKPDGNLDESKLLFLRNKGLAKVLYTEIDEEENKWRDYQYQEMQLIFELEHSIFSTLVVETLRLML